MSLPRLRITVAHADDATRQSLEDVLRGEHEVVARCATVSAMVESAVIDTPDFIVTGSSFDDGGAIEALIEIAEERAVPSVVVAPSEDMPSFEEAMADHVMSCLCEPVDDCDLLSAVKLAYGRHQQLEGAEQQARDLRDALEQRKVIERAKGVLMASGEMTEAEAFAAIRRRAQDQRERLIDVAHRVLTTQDTRSEARVESLNGDGKAGGNGSWSARDRESGAEMA